MVTVIEFLYDAVSDPNSMTSSYNDEKGKEEYRMEINDFLKDYDRGYELSGDGEILEIAPTGLEHIFEEKIQTDDPENIDIRIQDSIAKYRKYGATLSDKKDAIRGLADVLEFLKDKKITLPSKDDNDLFNIINGFDIRHHRRIQKSGYDKDIWYDWMFYTFLASIHVLIKGKWTEK